MTGLIHLSDFRLSRLGVTFDRAELCAILDLYSRRVARGEWRDYAIDMKDGVAVFSIFRSSFELPLYRIVKRSRPRQTEYILMSGQQKLRQEQSLGKLLSYLNARSLTLVK